jgi:hypothetical protein
MPQAVRFRPETGRHSDHYVAFTGCWHSEVMIRGTANAALAVVIASALDKYFSDGRYTNAVLAMLRPIRHAFGF